MLHRFWAWRGASCLRRVLSIGVAICALMAWHVGMAAETLVFCAEDGNARPWIMRDGSGLNFELLERVAHTLKLKIEYRRLPWKRCLDELKNNHVHGVVGASFKLERIEFGEYPGGLSPDEHKRINMDRYVLVRRKNSAVDWNGASFSGLDGVIGAQLGYSIAGYLKSQGVRVDEGSPGAAELLRKLQAGYIQAAALLEGEANALFMEQNSFAQTLEILPNPLVERAYYLILSHRLLATQPLRAAAIWNAIESVRESKEYLALEKLRLNGVSGR